jgi:oligoendopeptidase F
LRQNEDAETAIDVYKTINWIIGQLENIKHTALDLAEQDMRQRERETLSTLSGSAGWTEPKTQQLDEEDWERATSESPRLREIQREYEAAKARLESAQEPYMELPESRFYIR